MSLTLIGYRGTGKTSVARLLAQRLKCAWCDADAEIERRAGMTIKEIFDRGGEQAFRDLETAVIADLASQSDTILALGGGAAMREQNRQAIAGRTVIWLTAAPQTIHDRLQADQKTSQQRPNLTSQGGLAEIKQLLRQREPVYRSCADFIVTTDNRTPDQVADEIVYLNGGEAAT